MEGPAHDTGLSRRRRRYGIAAGAAVAVVVTLVWLFARSGQADSPLKVAVAAPIASGDRGAVALPREASKANPIAAAVVSRARLSVDIDVVGAATYDGDQFAVVGPLIEGRIVTLRARPGDAVAQGQVLQARVAFIEPLVDAETRTAKVRIEYRNAGHKLRPGQFVTARLVGGGRDHAPEVLAVPRKAVVAVEGRSVVFVEEGGRWSRRVVELGRSGGDVIEVRSGVQAGEKVVADGAFLLKSELLR